jgi:tRNA nucleotidyltransferase (CCA-adding enzyme)
MILPQDLQSILENFPEPILVGGAVRDHMLGLPPKDFDVEVHQTPPEKLQEILARFGEVETVGAAFGVIKLTTPQKNTYDFSSPRIDNKTGHSHKDFKITTNPDIPFHLSSSRRDLTINALGWNPHTKTLLDPFGGLEDLKNKTLRHINPQFGEDPLRPLRLLQFSARFGFNIHPTTIKICQNLKSSFSLNLLPKERVEKEFLKFLLEGKHHRLALKEFQKTGWLSFFPELENLHNLSQDPVHHPEGDVLTHTGLCLEALIHAPKYQNLETSQKKILAFATLCHDLGKSTTTQTQYNPTLGRVTVSSHNHQIEGLQPTKSLLEKLNQNEKTIEQVSLLVLHHMDHIWTTNTPASVAQLAAKLSPKNPHAINPTLSQSLKNLSILVEADYGGRHPKPPQLPEKMKELINTASQIGCLHAPLTNPIQGDDLIKIGFHPNKIFSDLLIGTYQTLLKNPTLTKTDLLTELKTQPEKILKSIGACPKPLINSQSLLNLGVPPGPKLGKTINHLLKLQIQGKVHTREDALKALQLNSVCLPPTPNILS